MDQKAFILVLIFSLLRILGYSQDKEIIPSDLQLQTAADYAKYEQNIIDANTWLIETPVDVEPNKRKIISAFILQWLTGSPNVSVDVSQGIVTYMNCPDCFMIFMSGWSNYSLTTRDFNNKLKANLAGTESVIKFYLANKQSIGEHEEIEKLVGLQKSGELESFIKSKIPE